MINLQHLRHCEVLVLSLAPYHEISINFSLIFQFINCFRDSKARRNYTLLLWQFAFIHI
jgi:hypothetical protein